MIAGLDSAGCPTPAQVAAAKAVGVRMWSGYLATLANVGLYSPWPSKANFDVARQAGATPIAFCSGWDSPGACKAKAAAWNVRLCLDVEGRIRPDGPWVQPWLAASGAGLYGNPPVHVGRVAAFHVLAAYPDAGDPKATWAGPTPPGAPPCGWQWRGTHPEFGIGVDRGWYDDWFLGEEMDQYSKDTNDKVTEVWDLLRQGTHAAQNPNWIRAELEGIKTAIAGIQAGSGGLTDGQAGQLTAIVQILTRIENSFKAA